MENSEVDPKEHFWTIRVAVVASIVLWLGIVTMIVLLAQGCVARSEYVDQLSQEQADTSATLANLAKSHENLAIEVGSAQAPVASKIATIAEIQAANAVDLADQSSGVKVDVGAIANKAMTGDWVGLGGLVVSTLMGGFAYQQKRKASQAHALAQEVRDLDPEKAREVWDKKKTI